VDIVCLFYLIKYGSRNSKETTERHQLYGFDPPSQPVGFMPFAQQKKPINFKGDVYYSNGNKKYESFFNRFYHPNKNKVYDDFHKDFYYSNGQKAYDGFHNHIFYLNGVKAYDGFFKVGHYDDGLKAGTENVAFTGDGVSMRLNGPTSEFWVTLGNGFFLLISFNGNSQSFRLFLDGNLVLEN
jgi:hypothetical protein